MNDITNHWRFQRILREAAEYRALRRMLLEAPRVPPLCGRYAENFLIEKTNPASSRRSSPPWGRTFNLTTNKQQTREKWSAFRDRAQIDLARRRT
jgi:hypothetical protein